MGVCSMFRSGGKKTILRNVQNEQGSGCTRNQDESRHARAESRRWGPQLIFNHAVPWVCDVVNRQGSKIVLRGARAPGAGGPCGRAPALPPPPPAWLLAGRLSIKYTRP